MHRERKRKMGREREKERERLFVYIVQAIDQNVITIQLVKCVLKRKNVWKKLCTQKKKRQLKSIIYTSE